MNFDFCSGLACLTYYSLNDRCDFTSEPCEAAELQYMMQSEAFTMLIITINNSND